MKKCLINTKNLCLYPLCWWSLTCMPRSSAALHVSHASETTTKDGICYSQSLPQALIGIPVTRNMSLQNFCTSNPFRNVFFTSL